MLLPFDLRPRRRLAAVACLIPACAAACVSGPPRRTGRVASTPPEPGAEWTPAPGAGAPFGPRETRLATREALIAPETASRMEALTLTDVLALALGNSPVTRASWAQARAAAAALGSARGSYFPELTAEVNAGPSKVVSANPARVPAERTVVAPALSLQYLLIDFGGRGGTNAAAREALFAADLTHNATLQNVVLDAEQAYFSYQAGRGLVAAARGAVETAQANLAAAERRHEVGLATIADVLQTRTALAQAELALQDADGNAQAARAQVALAMGLDANGPFEVAPDTGSAPVLELAESVDSLVAQAVRDRPDVAAARAIARQSEAQVRIARSATLPALALGATAGRSFSSTPALEGRTYALTFGLSVPLFSGLSRQYDVVAAREDAAASAARAERLRLEAVAQVFTSYHALRTATRRVSTSAELLTSATQSQEVARGRYAEGVGTVLDLLTAQTALADARAQAVLARWSWYASLAQLSRDTGVLGPHGETRLPLTPDPARDPGR
jgi:outer membrane protein TolC